MLDTAQQDFFQIDLLAREIVARLKDAGAGHCARVDFLDRVTALALCDYIQQQQLVQGVLFHILASDADQARTNALFILPDKAIELRNRKQERLCLFIPADLVDAAYSSIANSFALIDGRILQALVLKQVLAQLSPE